MNTFPTWVYIHLYNNECMYLPSLCSFCYQGQKDLKELRETGTLQDTRENRALFDVTEK